MEKSFFRIPNLWMKKSSEGSQFWGWTKFLKNFQFWGWEVLNNSNSVNEKKFWRIPILGMDKVSSEFQFWGWKVLKISNTVDEILSKKFQFWRWNVAGFWEFDLWYGLVCNCFCFVFVFSFSTTNWVSLGHQPNPSCPPFAENVSIFMGHFAPVPFQTLITTKCKEIKWTIWVLIASPKHA
jgi:hypothetical protein